VIRAALAKLTLKAPHQPADLVAVREQVRRGEARLPQPVAVDRQPGRALIAQRDDQARREPVRDAETRDPDRRAVPDVRDGRRGRRHQLVHYLA